MPNFSFKQVCCSFAIGLFTSAAMASPAKRFFIQGMGGFGSSSLDSYTQQINLFTGIDNRYVSNQSAEFSYLLGIGAGVYKPLCKKLTLAVSLNIYRVDFHDVTGVVQPAYNIATDFDQLNYAYSIDPTYAGLIQGRLIWNAQWSGVNVNPYVMFGAGLAYNQVSNYSESSPAGSTASPTLNPFNDNSSMHAAVTVGIGISHAFKNQNTIGIGYQYFYANHAYFSTANNQATATEFKSPVLQGNYLTIDYTFAV
ncbi:MAG: hypothetical protein P1U34_00665 [Coxiellaceae bacterium]|nr:hypothetical protein [Coxiellaceae bacterium]